MTGRPPKPIEERFWEKVEKKGDCWEWTSAKDKDGYPLIKRKDGRQLKAHRVSYEIHIGDIPDGMCVCHHCDNPGCVNPDHLWVGTNQDNTRDKTIKGRARNQTTVQTLGYVRCH